MAQKPVDFTGLLAAFAKVLELAFEKRDAKILRDAYDSFTANSDHDKKSPMDQAFRELLLFRLRDGVKAKMIGDLVRLSVDAVRLEIVSVTIPVVLLGDIFETVTLDKCERIFGFVEDMVEVWKEDIFFSSCKNNILRMCNDMLRRLSRAQNTIFCGRILLFLSKFFPFSERSGLNIVSEFNLDNVTDYGVDKDLDDALEDTVEDIPIKIDYNLYCKFWSLQDFFRNPNQCYSKAQWKMFQAHADTILEAFSSFKLEEPRYNSTTNGDGNDRMDVQDFQQVLDLDVDMIAGVAKKIDNGTSELAQGLRKSDNFFAKFLTNPKLLALQLSDSNFRRSLLVQFLILFQYLQLTVKFKTESNTLTQAQSDFIKETESKVYHLLEETPPNGARFARTVRHMLAREEMWNNWKNEGCKEFKKPDEAQSVDTEKTKPPPAKRAKPTLGDCLRDANRSGKFYLGNDVLSRLWNYSPDNLLACKSEERNFLPQLETYLESSHEKNDTSFEWRALRLLARQSPHFFIFTNTASYKVSDYLDNVRRRMVREKLESVKTLGVGVIASNSAETIGSNEAAGESNEQETVALQEQEADGDGDGELADDPEEKSTRAVPMTASLEQIEEIAPLIGEDWKKLGKKLGFEASELRDFEASHPERDGGCITMLVSWFQDDEDATLENWAYMLEGLKMDAAAKAVNALMQRLCEQQAGMEDAEVISD